MEFKWEGKAVNWKGSPWISDDPLTVGQLKCLVASTREAYLLYLEGEENKDELHTTYAEITNLIQKFNDIFEPQQRERPLYSR